MALGCGSNEGQINRPIPGTTAKQPPITEQGVEAAKARLVTAGNLLIKYAKAKGFPNVGDSIQLRDLLRSEYGNEPGFEELWRSHNGKTLLHYNANIAGKAFADVSNPDGTWMLKDPVSFSPDGYPVVYVSGRVAAVTEKPVLGAPSSM
jgi:hypothetical protein